MATPSTYLGQGIYNTILGGTGRSLAGAVADAANASYIATEGI